mmetsp:Transcript_5639/g.7734  ORF Transcript_5639/g.7734 Transcript_5639/m.7734 type:complete len:82 (+) Transcript_5639:334-579(+)
MTEYDWLLVKNFPPDLGCFGGGMESMESLASRLCPMRAIGEVSSSLLETAKGRGGNSTDGGGNNSSGGGTSNETDDLFSSP